MPPSKPTFSGLFQPSLFKSLLFKAKVLGKFGGKPSESLVQPQAISSETIFADQAIEADMVPTPKTFLDLVKPQWEFPTSGPIPTSNDKTFFNVDKDMAQVLLQPTINAPVTALHTTANMPGAPEDALKPEDKKVDLTLQRGHQAAAWAGNTKYLAGGGGGGDDCPTLAQVTLVRRPPISLCGQTVEDPSRNDFGQPGVAGASGPSVAPIDRLALEQSVLREDKYSSRVIQTIQAARRPSTERIYSSTWHSFCTCCTSKNFDLVQATVPQVLDFLQVGLDKGLAPNTIRRQVSAISSVFLCDRSRTLTQHPMVRWFIKGASNLKPPTVHRYPSWDLHKLLDALTCAPFEPLRKVSLRFLTLKVAFLVAITSARRVSELQALPTRDDLCIFHHDKVVLRLDPSFIPKVCSCFHRSEELILPNFCPDSSHPLEKKWHTLDALGPVQTWLGQELEKCGIDAMIYTRYVLSLLLHDNYDYDLQEQI
ncbi:PREDICTED: uncharacterized protein LOC106553274 [Thamnophis sirtalis]|uniref:Uncharacterized protein LOC106553274 n=1 Tax=Thamnophis sirtalis TaxID=35019 RepID=A0A6I9YTC6_9SAUR|nr:PREDICTED: uncharacterized protein LOC106553274 [Thamnophis sirtalis]